MWFWRGAQSAAFYYVTCTPCADAAYRRKRKREALRSQREKAKLAPAVVTDQPRPFQQPTPFSTNEAWREEIALGPGPPPRRGGHRPNNQRGDAWQPEEPVRTDGSRADPAHRKDRNPLIHASLSDRWNRLRYQREDEPLWGEDPDHDADRVGSSIGVRGRTRAETDTSSKYYSATVPPVNDLHPPIVSAPRSRAETRWMLQPPPSAKVMAGKEPSSYRARTGRGMDRDDARPRASDDRAGREGRIQLAAESRTTLHASSLVDEATTQRPASDTTTPNGTIHKLAGTSSIPRRPPLTLTLLPRTYHGYEDRDRMAMSPDSPTSTVSTLADTLERRSPTLLWQYPDTPVSRPTSKATVDSAKALRSTITKSLTTVQRDPSGKRIHMLRLEIDNDPKDDFEVGHMEKIRPWRWSMDI